MVSGSITSWCPFGDFEEARYDFHILSLIEGSTMKTKLKAGDRVRIKSYEGAEVTGIVTKVGKERTEDWKYLAMCHVTYDQPVMKNIRGAFIHVLMGQHLPSELEPL